MVQLRTVEATADLRTLVHELATADRDGERFSMYVDLDPREYATAPARKSGITAALDEAGRAAPDSSWTPLLDELRSTFEESNYQIDGAHGLLVYASRDGDPTIVKLPTPVQQHVSFDRCVPVRPLVEALAGERWCVLLVNRRSSRLLIGDRHGLEQVGAWRDDVEGQHEKGGWSQARYQRVIEGQVHDHVRDTARILRELRGSGNYERLLVAAPHELHGLVEHELHDSVRRVFCGFIEVDVEHSSVRDVELVVQRRILEFADSCNDDLLAQLQQNLGRRERVAQGLDNVLAAVREARVGTLLVAEGFGSPGWVCTHGDWVSRTVEQCPVHGIDLEPVADVVEAAIEMAVQRDARIVTVQRGDELVAAGSDGALADRKQYQLLTQLGSIAALVRFDLDEGARSTGPTTD